MVIKSKDKSLFIKSLKENGVDSIYIPKSRSGGVGAEAVYAPVNAAPQGGQSKKIELLLKLREEAVKCTLCHELASTRKNVVFGSGNAKARLMFVGEAPGRDEDEQGLPFVGRAGQLLTKIIESAGLSREQVFIANTLKCRPPKNRPPEPEEVANCGSFLTRQIQIINPEIICALGTFASQALLKSTLPISQLRGKFTLLNGIKIICTFHPAYLLRNPNEKRKVWEDMIKIKQELAKDNPKS
ncbi:MAG: hypothetical protein A2Z83_05075 [Omnitrophica bacterium GWA2_52_8]|nr:MAG: hypothetical protein A2Z83_05075 [Omnitrophica bacterium GWA2_52_8]